MATVMYDCCCPPPKCCCPPCCPPPCRHDDALYDDCNPPCCPNICGPPPCCCQPPCPAPMGFGCGGPPPCADAPVQADAGYDGMFTAAPAQYNQRQSRTGMMHQSNQQQQQQHSRTQQAASAQPSSPSVINLQPGSFYAVGGELFKTPELPAPTSNPRSPSASNMVMQAHRSTTGQYGMDSPADSHASNRQMSQQRSRQYQQYQQPQRYAYDDDCCCPPGKPETAGCSLPAPCCCEPPAGVQARKRPRDDADVSYVKRPRLAAHVQHSRHMHRGQRLGRNTMHGYRRHY